MNDNLDRILVGEEPIVPSIGFVSQVMNAVRRVGIDIAPIRFPWRRFVLGAAGASVCTLLSCVILLVRESPGQGSLGPIAWIYSTHSSYATSLLCAMIAFVASLLTIRVSMDLTSD